MEPRFDILLKALLSLEAVRDRYNWPAGKKGAEQDCQKRLCRLADAETRQHSAILRLPREALHGGSLQHFGEQTAFRFHWSLRQARATSQLAPSRSRDGQCLAR
jgi:hypothetical protein